MKPMIRQAYVLDGVFAPIPHAKPLMRPFIEIAQELPSPLLPICFALQSSFRLAVKTQRPRLRSSNVQRGGPNASAAKMSCPHFQNEG